jgi:hypothetical protein
LRRPGDVAAAFCTALASQFPDEKIPAMQSDNCARKSVQNGTGARMPGVQEA